MPVIQRSLPSRRRGRGGAPATTRSRSRCISRRPEARASGRPKASTPTGTRPIRLSQWQAEIVGRRPQQFVRDLLHSDGCRITNFAISRKRRRYEYPRYFFSNASVDLQALLCLALLELGVDYTQPKPRVLSIARAPSVRQLDRFVRPKA